MESHGSLFKRIEQMGTPTVREFLEFAITECSICHPQTGTVQWRVLDTSEEGGLFELVNVGSASIEKWQVLKAIGDVLHDVGLNSLRGNQELQIDRFANGVAICEMNGDYIFLLPEGSVWCFWHDGHEAQLLADNWAEWCNSITRLAPSEPAARNLVGKWKPVSSKTENPRRFALLYDVLEFFSNGQGIKNYPNGTSSSFSWEATGTTITFFRPEAVEYEYHLEGKTLDLRLLDGSRHCRYEKT